MDAYILLLLCANNLNSMITAPLDVDSSSQLFPNGRLDVKSNHFAPHERCIVSN